MPVLNFYIGKVKLVRFELGSRPAADVTARESDNWLSAGRISPAPANRYKSFISLCYREGMRNGKVDVNPARMVRQRKEPLGRLHFLSREEFASVLASVPEKHRPALLLDVHTGMRLSEQFTLDWSQVRLKLGTIQLTRTKKRLCSYHPTELSCTCRVGDPQAGRSKPSGPVFEVTSKADSYGIRRWFKPAIAEVGISDFTWHGLRHTYCSWLAMAGASIRKIQELAGHRSISVSAKYSHLSPEHSQSVVNRLVAED